MESDSTLEEARALCRCPLCDNIVIDPVRLKNCGHAFCRICLTLRIRRQRCCPQCSIDLNEAGPSSYVPDIGLQEMCYRLFPSETTSSLRRKYFYAKREASVEMKVYMDNLRALAQHMCYPGEKINVKIRVNPTQFCLNFDVNNEDSRFKNSEINLKCTSDLPIRTLKKLIARKFLHSCRTLLIHLFTPESMPLHDSNNIRDLVFLCGGFDGIHPIKILANVQSGEPEKAMDDMPILEAESYEADAKLAEASCSKSETTTQCKSEFPPTNQEKEVKHPVLPNVQDKQKKKRISEATAEAKPPKIRRRIPTANTSDASLDKPHLSKLAEIFRSINLPPSHSPTSDANIFPRNNGAPKRFPYSLNLASPVVERLLSSMGQNNSLAALNSALGNAVAYSSLMNLDSFPTLLNEKSTLNANSRLSKPGAAVSPMRRENLETSSSDHGNEDKVGCGDLHTAVQIA